MIDTILDHRTIRKYKNTPVEKEIINDLIKAGTRASTTGNMQLYSIIITTDEENKKRLAPSHFNQSMITEAPLLMTFCADFNRFNKWCELRKAKPGYDNFLSFTTAAIDAIIVAQNVALAAEDKGLGICYLGTTTYMAKNIIEILNLPKGVVPVTTLTIGYPGEDPSLVDRLPLEAVSHYESYKDYTPEVIDNLYREKESLDEYKEFIKENNKETLAQVFTDVRYKKEDNVSFSKLFLSVLEDQGFMNQ